MNNYFIKSLVLFFCCILFFSTELHSQELMQGNSNVVDTLQTQVDKNHQKNNYWNLLIHGNIDRSYEKKLDLSYLITPFYGREASFGIGGMATGLYRLDRSDSLMQPSNIILGFSASINGFYSLGIEGNNNFKQNRSRLYYKVVFNNKNLNLWGFNYNDCNVNPAVKYRRQMAKVYANYQYELLTNFYVVGTLDFSYTKAVKISDISYLQGQKNSYTTTGLGLSAQYDSRDFVLNPKRGAYFYLRQTIYPEILGDAGKTIWRTTFQANYYKKVWNGGILAFDLYGEVSSNNLPWSLREELGGPNRMRGYYSGRYIDNDITSAQIELRQHIAGRFGCAAWIGAGTVFPSIKEFDTTKILPNYGLGLHFEIKHNTNARLDYGFGKNTSGFVLGLSTAF